MKPIGFLFDSDNSRKMIVFKKPMLIWFINYSEIPSAIEVIEFIYTGAPKMEGFSDMSAENA